MKFEELHALAASRVNFTARRLVAPGPDEAQLMALLSLATTAPDHGQLAPWRFILVPADARERLGEAFGRALVERDAEASPDEVAQAKEKAQRAPTLLIAIVRLAGDDAPQIPALERTVSFGAAVQNILLGAQAMGFGTGLTSGKAMESRPMRELCELAPDEHAVCCINIGTPSVSRAPRENRKKPEDILRVLPSR
jgi:nitroreductase